ncbi:Merops: M20.UNA [Paxillus involutus ATCC 200175]|nr:Merops: M20.UNA [Paxillus involutus ATCC 200175]
MVQAPPQNDKVALSDDFAVHDSAWKAKADVELGAGLGSGQLKSQRTATRSTLLGLACLLSAVILVPRLWSAILQLAQPHKSEGIHAFDNLCPQVEALTSVSHAALLDDLDEEYASTEFKLKAYESLGGAVRIPTECFDDLGLPSEDPRWEIETKLHEYLESRFPKVHATLRRIKVNTYALVYEWKGTDDSVKPLLLAAHLDVVPVNPATYDDWINPPYSGYFDGEWIWGRGSCDDKPGVIGSLIAIESLLERGFVPSRTVLLAFGIDEERGGHTGASAIGRYLLEMYGPNSIAMLVDEGGIYADMSGTVFATPAVAEKGYIDVRMDVLTPGGHSSKPPKHTGIGILADLITELEARPHEPELFRGRTYYQSLECRAKYDEGFPASLKKLVHQSQTSDEKLRELGGRLLEFDPAFYALSGTTQAIDLVGGGVKVNALPESVWAVANHRIADHSSPAELMDRFTAVTAPVAAKHNMTLEAFGKLVGPKGPSWGTIRLSDSFDSALVPAPVTPTTESGPYELLSGTILSTLQTNLRTDDFPTSTVVSPGLSTDMHNSDTRHYWNLTKHIFRYGHRGATDGYNGAHTINEAIRAEGFLEQIRFFSRIILNADRTDLLE